MEYNSYAGELLLNCELIELIQICDLDNSGESLQHFNSEVIMEYSVQFKDYNLWTNEAGGFTALVN